MRTRKIYHTLVTLSLVGLLTACGGGAVVAEAMMHPLL